MTTCALALATMPPHLWTAVALYSQGTIDLKTLAVTLRIIGWSDVIGCVVGIGGLWT